MKILYQTAAKSSSRNTNILTHISAHSHKHSSTLTFALHYERPLSTLQTFAHFIYTHCTVFSQTYRIINIMIHSLDTRTHTQTHTAFRGAVALFVCSPSHSFYFLVLQAMLLRFSAQIKTIKFFIHCSFFFSSHIFELCGFSFISFFLSFCLHTLTHMATYIFMTLLRHLLNGS